MNLRRFILVLQITTLAAAMPAIAAVGSNPPWQGETAVGWQEGKTSLRLRYCIDFINQCQESGSRRYLAIEYRFGADGSPNQKTIMRGDKLVGSFSVSEGEPFRMAVLDAFEPLIIPSPDPLGEIFEWLQLRQQQSPAGRQNGERADSAKVRYFQVLRALLTLMHDYLAAYSSDDDNQRQTKFTRLEQAVEKALDRQNKDFWQPSILSAKIAFLEKSLSEAHRRYLDLSSNIYLGATRPLAGGPGSTTGAEAAFCNLVLKNLAVRNLWLGEKMQSWLSQGVFRLFDMAHPSGNPANTQTDYRGEAPLPITLYRDFFPADAQGKCCALPVALDEKLRRDGTAETWGPYFGAISFLRRQGVGESQGVLVHEAGHWLAAGGGAPSARQKKWREIAQRASLRSVLAGLLQRLYRGETGGTLEDGFRLNQKLVQSLAEETELSAIWQQLSPAWADELAADQLHPWSFFSEMQAHAFSVDALVRQ